MAATAPTTYLTTTIPYVNARPHLGFALELVQADALARHARARRTGPVRLQAGTDDHSLKNVLAAEAAGRPVREYVDAHAAAFEALSGALRLSPDAFVRTSADPRHRPAVEALWRACTERGDLYRRRYRGRYCLGCEAFYEEAELDAGGRCGEHREPAEWVEEENWFFRLSRHAPALRRLIGEGTIRITPDTRRREALALLDGGLPDISVSRSAARARGWGIPVPGDPSQVVYVWFDALANYLTGLGFGGGGADLRWWTGDGARRVHLLGKGVLKFHAVYWPAILLSAGLPVPTELRVHGYLTVDGAKISKSAGTAVDPAETAARYGADAVRWWLLREVPPGGDADFTEARLVARANDELANGIGNLVSRVAAMVRRFCGGAVAECPPPAGDPLAGRLESVAGAVDAAVAAADLRAATGALRDLAEEGNRFVDRTRPWEAARAGDEEAVRAALGALLLACRRIGAELAPFAPDLSARIAAAVAAPGEADGPLFARLEAPA